MGFPGFCVIFVTVAILYEAAGQYTAGDEPPWRFKTPVTTEQTPPTTYSILQPIPLCQFETPNSTRRTTTSMSKCLEAVLEPTDWDTAHKHCRKSNGFLFGLEEWESVHLPEVWSNVTAWTALRRFNNHQQWLGERPACSPFPNWDGDTPPPWSKACGALKVGERVFQQRDCAAKLPFICVHYAEYEETPGMIDYDDVELRLESDHNSTMGWISIKEEEFKKLNLKCRAYVKSTGAVLEDLPVFWTRDGVFLNHKTHALQPSTVYDSTRVSFIEGKQNNVVVKQGTFWCETWRPGSTKMMQSNKVLVTFSDWETYVIKIYRYERINSTTKSSLKRLRNALHYDFKLSNVYDIPADLIQAERVTQHKSQKVLTINTFHLHIPKKNLNEFIALEHRQDLIETMFNKNNYERTSWMKQVHTCFSENQVLPLGNILAWDQSDSGKPLYPSEPQKYRCESYQDTLKWGYCQWNYTHGASYELFNSSACSHLDMCPRGYRGVANQFCVKFVHPMVWEEGFKEAFQTGEETSIIDDPKDFKSVFEHIKQLYKEEIQKIANPTQYGLVWLPVKRPNWHSPFLHVGPNKSEFPFSNVSWEKGHPMRGQNCLALNLTSKSLYTLPCHRKIPFVTLIKPFGSENVIKSSKICKDGWLSSGLHFQHNKCFKMFKETVNSTWIEAEQFCKSKGAELPLPTSGFSYLVYESLQKQTYVSFWINVKYDTLNRNIITPDNVKDFIDWIPGVNYNNRYGAMVENGWALETPTNTKSNIVCEKSVQPKQVKINLHKPENPLSKNMCISIDNTEYFDESRGLTCFVNGQPIYPSQVQDDNCMYELSIKEQGYHWCEGWSWSPFMLIKSNKFLLRMPQIYTFAVRIYDPHNNYDPAHHDSTYMVHNTKLDSTNPNSSPASSMKKYLRPKYKNYKVMIKNVFYSDVGGDKGMFIDFHLELKHIRNGSTGRNISEEQIYNETITNILVPNTTINNFTIIHFRSTVQCPHNETSDEYKKFLTWPRALTGEVVLPNELCITSDGNPVTMKCQGNFMDGLYWDNLEGECAGTPTNVTRELWSMTKSNEPPEQLTAQLVNLTENGNILQAIDIHFVSSTFKTLTNRAEVSNLDLDDIVQTMNNVMGVEPNRIESVQKRLNSSSLLLASFETLTFDVHMPEVNGKEKANSSKSFLSVDRINLDKDSDVIGYMSSKSTGKDQTSVLTKGIQIDYIDADAALILPETLTFKVFKDPSIKKKKTIIEKEKVKVTFAVYRNNHLFQQDNNTDDNYVINSQIIMATYKDIEINNLTEPVEILFKPIHKGQDVRCVYWDFQGNGGRGNWSEKGCKYRGETKSGHQHCQCNHLTCFAQLINYNDIGDFENHAIVLHVITIIGCLLSIASLLLVFTTFFIFKKWRRSLSNKILVNLSFAVFCTLVIFLAGIDQVWNSILCRGVAVALHYFILASFGWMLAEAVHQYLKFVKVVGTYIPRFIWKASVCAWGLPVVPILVLLVYDSELYDSDLEEGKKICWMSATGFKYAFLPILALTMGINMIFFMLILHGAMCGRERINSTLPERELLLNQLSMAVCVFILLGFTWIFGILAIKDARIVFSYLFCIFNTLQGFFIFIFHVARERNANRLWRDFLSVITGDSSSSTPGNSINPHPSLHPTGTVDGVLYGKGGNIMIVPRNSPNGHCRTSLVSTRTNSSLVHSRASFLP
ncbi:uncharacterized protein LOC143040596 isoform X2 [Oratosquilla oratoria]|uniref:uncharacterized protein LOC143040596 isoform X2 n=1 Tax=Oratosquilla oratoria TaxID=337810 RepID=UPI003F75DCB9